MKPIQQTVEAVTEVSRYTGDDLLATLQRMADSIQGVVPDCTGVSIAWSEHGVTFTLVASEEEIALLDALQYLEGGPCVDALNLGHGIETSHDTLMDEEDWRLFAQGTSAAAVRSTLTFPVTEQGRVVGTINLYGASDHAFEGHHDELADLLGAWAPGAVRNADLSFATRHTAEQAPQALQAQAVVNRAVGILAAQAGLELSAASELLRSAAARAGVRPEQLAEALIRLRG